MPGMAWANNLLDCSFRGVVFDVVGTRDAYGKAVSVAEVPYVDGGTVRDLGGRPVHYSLQAVFFGDDYEDRLATAKAAFNARGSGELVHPVYGVIASALCVSYEVVHSAEAPDSCTVSLDFIEDGKPLAFFEQAGAEQVQANVGTLGDEALDATAGQLADIVAAIRSASPLASLDDLRQSMLGPLLGFSSQVQGVTLSGLDLLDEPREWANDIAALSDGIIGAASFDDNLLGDWRSVTDVFTGLETTYGYGGGSGGSVSPWTLGAVLTEAQGMALVNVCLTVNSVTAQADVAAIVLAAEAATPTLSPDEIETVVDTARAAIEAAIVIARAALPLEKSRAIAEPLKDQALVLQKIAKALIELRPPIVMRSLPVAGNLRLIAHLWYGDHSRSLELLRLNALASPNALQKGDVLRAYVR